MFLQNVTFVFYVYIKIFIYPSKLKGKRCLFVTFDLLYFSFAMIDKSLSANIIDGFSSQHNFCTLTLHLEDSVHHILG